MSIFHLNELFDQLTGPSEDKVYYVPIEKIVPNPYQPRRVFDRTSIDELCLSVRQYGILQPLLVRKMEDCYELIAGERRLKAAGQAGLKEIPVIIKQFDETDAAVVALIENVQRRDLSYWEEAKAFDTLIRVHGMTQEMIADRVGKNQSTIANKLRLLRLSESVKRQLVINKLSERHARALLRLHDEEVQLEILNEVISKSLNVQETEKLVEKALLSCQKKEMKQKKEAKLGITKDLRLFFNTVNKAIDSMKQAGVMARTEKTDYENYIKYSIIIPKAGKNKNVSRET
ncbi:MAG: nucleoid occlusion protein [Clostridia bacterium]|nr:nucleoid occlusion protein [Clostridia bacterium]